MVTVSMSSTKATLLAPFGESERLGECEQGQMQAFRGRLLVGMWYNENLLKLAQVKHRICHTHGNDIKLVCDGAPGFSEV